MICLYARAWLIAGCVALTGQEESLDLSGLPSQDFSSRFTTLQHVVYKTFVLLCLIESVWIHRHEHIYLWSWMALKKVGQTWQALAGYTMLHWAGNLPRRWLGRRRVEKRGKWEREPGFSHGSLQISCVCVGQWVFHPVRQRRHYVLLSVTHLLNSKTPRNSQNKAG